MATDSFLDYIQNDQQAENGKRLASRFSPLQQDGSQTFLKNHLQALVCFSLLDEV